MTVPMIVYYRGRPVDEMTPAELRAAARPYLRRLSRIGPYELDALVVLLQRAEFDIDELQAYWEAAWGK